MPPSRKLCIFLHELLHSCKYFFVFQTCLILQTCLRHPCTPAGHPANTCHRQLQLPETADRQVGCEGVCTPFLSKALSLTFPPGAAAA